MREKYSRSLIGVKNDWAAEDLFRFIMANNWPCVKVNIWYIGLRRFKKQKGPKSRVKF